MTQSKLFYEKYFKPGGHRWLLFGVLCFFLGQIVHAQQGSVSGTVTDAAGVPLPGASVVEKGTTNGVTTDFDGNYTITTPTTGAALVFSYVGYTAKEIPVNQSARINVSLQEDTQALDEVIVVGYGTQSKSSVSGSISSLKSEDLKDLTVTGVDQMLSGQVAGVQINQSNAAPGGAVKVNIRGTVSINSNASPLYVIDGYPLSVQDNQVANPLNSINPNDIESIEILKDASASAIYGSRASNGVVIITTKRGDSNKTTFNLNMYTGFQEVDNKVDVLNANEFAAAYIESRNNGYLAGFGDLGAQASDSNEQRIALGANNAPEYLINPSLADPSVFGRGTDWQDEIFRSAPISNIQLSASGGGENVRYYLSGGYFDQEGVIKESGFNRYSVNSSIEGNVGTKFKLGSNINLSYTETDIVNAEGTYNSGGLVSSALVLAPTMPVLNEEGEYNTHRNFYPSNIGLVPAINPVQLLNEIDRDADQLRVFGNVFGSYEIVDGLTFKTLVGADYFSYVEDKYSPSTVPAVARGGNTAYRINNSSLNILSEFTLNYTKSLGKHNFDVLAGYTAQTERIERTRVESTDFPNDLITDVSGGVISNYVSNPQEWALNSILGRFNYDYNRKYLLSLSFRRDGSSRFGVNNRYGNFPSASVAWRVSEEEFLKDNEVISNLKFRGSYGLTGNNGIGNYASLGVLEGSNAVLNGGVSLGQARQTIPNNLLSWETTSQLNVGIDLSLFGGRIGLVADYYDKLTEDLLLNVPVTATSGVLSRTDNIGEVSNTGWELGINTNNFVGDFKWSTNFNISANRNEVKKLGNDDAPIFFEAIQNFTTHVVQVGSPIGSYFGWQTDGVYQTQAEIDQGPDIQLSGDSPAAPGDVKFRDIDGNGVIDDDDRQIIGDWQPDFIYGITNNFSYKQLDLSVLIQGSQGNEVFNSQYRNTGLQVAYGNLYQETYDNRWQSPQNPGDGLTPILKRDLKYNNTTRPSNLYVQDASYLRIRNITLGYTLSPDAAKKIGLSTMRTYVSVQNAFLFTDYINYNPEVNAATTVDPYSSDINNLAPGVDYGSYPSARTITLGFNFSF